MNNKETYKQHLRELIDGENCTDWRKVCRHLLHLIEYQNVEIEKLRQELCSYENRNARNILRVIKQHTGEVYEH